MNDGVDSLPSVPPISRRDMLRLLALAGLLAGCGPARQAAVTATAGPTDAPPATAIPTEAPTATVTPSSTPSPAPSPTASQTASPVPSPTAQATATPSPAAVAAKRPEIIKFYPDVKSRVVQAHHSGVWDGKKLVPAAIKNMLDAAMTGLTGLGDAGQAWAALFKPGERVAIKVNVFQNSVLWTHWPLVVAVTDALQRAGIAAEDILVFDATTRELSTAGYAVNRDGAGVRCAGIDNKHEGSFPVAGTALALGPAVLNCDALINMPILKGHMITGMTFALKNHYGTVDTPSRLHYAFDRAMAELNALPAIRDRTRLVIGDVLEANLKFAGSWPYWKADYTGDSILVSFDPVAHDTVGLDRLVALQTEAKVFTSFTTGQCTPYLKAAAGLGLGTNDLANIEQVEVKAG